MIENFEKSLLIVLKHEGLGLPNNPLGFVNHPSDPGGATQLGVTKKVWEEWVGHTVNVAEMKEQITVEAVAPLYKQKYWDKVKGDQLPTGLDHAVFDYAVNSGVGRAAKHLQRVVGVAEDGMIGAKTIAAVEAMEVAEVVDQLCAVRLAFLQKLPTFATFGKGWSRRVAEVEDQARAFIA